MKDGLYQVDAGSVCAAFVIRDGKLAECAPILRRNFEHWRRIARPVDCNGDRAFIISRPEAQRGPVAHLT